MRPKCSQMLLEIAKIYLEKKFANGIRCLKMEVWYFELLLTPQYNRDLAPMDFALSKFGTEIFGLK